MMHRHARAGLGVLLVGMAAGACDDQGPVHERPAALEALTPEPITGLLGEPLTEPLAVRVTDDEGRPVRGVVVRFGVEDGEGVLAPDTATTDAEGVAQVSFTPYGFIGQARVSASLAGVPDQAFSIAVTAAMQDLAGFPDHYVRVGDANEDGTIVGWVRGSSDLDTYDAAMRWTEESGLELLPSPDVTPGTRAVAINRAGHAVGFSAIPFGRSSALLWQVHQAEVLPGAGDVEAYAFGINASGDMVGRVGGDAVVWRDGQLVRLDEGQHSCGRESWLTTAHAINGRGEVVGSAPATDWDCFGQAPSRAVRWSSTGTMEYLPIPGDEPSEAVAINEKGEVLVRVGGAREPTRAYFWSVSTGAIQLEAEGATGTAVTALNDSSFIGGAVFPDSAQGLSKPAIWRAPTAEPILLEFPEGPEDYLSPVVTALTNNGWAVGDAMHYNGADWLSRAVRWRIYMPLPAP